MSLGILEFGWAQGGRDANEMEVEPTEGIVNSANKPLRSLLEIRESEISRLVPLTTILQSTHEELSFSVLVLNINKYMHIYIYTLYRERLPSADAKKFEAFLEILGSLEIQ